MQRGSKTASDNDLRQNIRSERHRRNGRERLAGHEIKRSPTIPLTPTGFETPMTKSATSVRTALILLMVAAVAGCPTDTPSDEPGITLALDVSAVSVAQGSSGSVNATITRVNFPGTVTLAVDGLPTGVTAAFDPATLTDAVTTTKLTFTVAASAAPGVSNLTVKASGTGISEKTMPVALTVTVTGSYSLSMTPTSRTVTQGGSTTATINVTRTGGFTGAVAFAASGAPSGVTAAISPSSVTDASATLTLTATNAATLGAATITITGTTPGLANQTTTLSLTVQAASALTALSYPLCADDGPATNVLWFGYKNEGGSWVQVTPVNGVVSFNATAKVMTRLVFGSGGVGGSFFSNDLAMLTAAEIQQFPQTCPRSQGTKTLNLTTAGTSTGQTVRVDMGGSGTSIVHPSTTGSLTSVLDGAIDLVASRGVVTNGNGAPNAIIIRRGLNLTGGSNIPVLDFGAAEAIAPATAALTLTGTVAGESNFASVRFHATGKTNADLWSTQVAGTTANMSLVASSQSVAGDVHQLEVFAEAATSTRAVIQFFRTPGAKTAALGPALNTPTVTQVASSPIGRYRVQLASQTDYSSLVNWGMNQTGRDLWVTVSAGFLGGTPTTWDITHPDMTGAPGWNNNWGLVSGATNDTYVLAATAEIYLVGGTAGPDGTSAKYAERQISGVTPPSLERGSMQRRRLVPPALRR